MKAEMYNCRVVNLKPTVGNRKNVRLPGFDYTGAGAYFVTICCDDMKHLLGTVEAATVKLNRIGEVVERVLLSLPDHHNVLIDEYVVMPNHIHFIVVLEPSRFVETFKGCPRAAPTGKPIALPALVGLLKQASTREIRTLTGDPTYVVFHRGYHDHIIRDADDLHTRRQYIRSNPLRWGTSR